MQRSENYLSINEDDAIKDKVQEINYIITEIKKKEKANITEGTQMTFRLVSWKTDINSHNPDENENKQNV